MSLSYSEDARDRAVQVVDQRRGYTVEFSPSPEEHQDDYDREYERIRECESAMLCHHAATGDDLPCVCGAHPLPWERW